MVRHKGGGVIRKRPWRGFIVMGGVCGGRNAILTKEKAPILQLGLRAWRVSLDRAFRVDTLLRKGQQARMPALQNDQPLSPTLEVAE